MESEIDVLHETSERCANLSRGAGEPRDVATMYHVDAKTRKDSDNVVGVIANDTVKSCQDARLASLTTIDGQADLQTVVVCTEVLNSLVSQVCTNHDCNFIKDDVCAEEVVMVDDVDNTESTSGLSTSKEELSRISASKRNIDQNTEWFIDLPFTESLELPDSETVGDEKDSPKVSKKRKKKKSKKVKSTTSTMTPTHFVAVQITDSKVIENFCSIQQGLLEVEPKLKQALTNAKSLHITLCVLNCTDTLDSAVGALKTSFTVIKEKSYSDNLTITFEGLGHFKNQVLFAVVKDGEEKDHLCDIAKIVQAKLIENGFEPEGRDLTPHLTIAKLSKSPKLRRMIKKIDPKCYEEYKDCILGCQRIMSLQLLSMAKKGDDRYYYCEEELFF